MNFSESNDADRFTIVNESGFTPSPPSSGNYHCSHLTEKQSRKGHPKVAYFGQF